jgi:hypothetical protein
MEKEGFIDIDLELDVNNSKKNCKSSIGLQLNNLLYDTNNDTKIIINEHPHICISSFPKHQDESTNCCQSKLHSCNNKRKDYKACCQGLYWVCNWWCKSMCHYCFNKVVRE